MPDAFKALLNHFALQEQRNAVPGMVVQSSIVITAQKLVQVDIKKPVARNDVPAVEVIAPNLDIGFSHGSSPTWTTIGYQPAVRPLQNFTSPMNR